MALLDKDREYNPGEYARLIKLSKLLCPADSSDSLAKVIGRLMVDGYTIVPAGNEFQPQVSGGRVMGAYNDALIFEGVTSGHWIIGSGDGRTQVNGESVTYFISDRVGVSRDWKVKRSTLGNDSPGETLDCTLRVGYIPLPKPEKPTDPASKS